MLLRLSWIGLSLSCGISAFAALSSGEMTMSACSFLFANAQNIDRHFREDTPPTPEEIDVFMDHDSLLEAELQRSGRQLDFASATAARIPQPYLEEALLRWHQTMRVDAITAAEASMSDFGEAQQVYTDLRRQEEDGKSRMSFHMSTLRLAIIAPAFFDQRWAVACLGSYCALQFLEHPIVDFVFRSVTSKIKNLERRWGQDALRLRRRVTPLDLAKINTAPREIYDLWKPQLNRKVRQYAILMMNQNHQLIGIFGANLMESSNGAEPDFRIFLIPTIPGSR